MFGHWWDLTSRRMGNINTCIYIKHSQYIDIIRRWWLLVCQNVPNWHRDIVRVCENIPIVLVGNKVGRAAGLSRQICHVQQGDGLKCSRNRNYCRYAGVDTDTCGGVMCMCMYVYMYFLCIYVYNCIYISIRYILCLFTYMHTHHMCSTHIYTAVQKTAVTTAPFQYAKRGFVPGGRQGPPG